MSHSTTQTTFLAVPTPVRRIRELPPNEQPLYRLRQNGESALSTAELLEVISGARATDTGRNLLAELDGLHGINRASLHDLTQLDGIGPIGAARIKAAFELGRRLATASRDERPSVRAPGDAANLLMAEMSAYEQEHMRVVLLDTRNRVLGAPTIYIGNLNTAVVRIGELFRHAIRHNCAALIVAHNHPSGDPTPSPEDVRVTEQIVAAGKLLDIEVLDHLVIADMKFVSLKERGLGFA